MEQNTVLEVRNVSKSFGPTKALVDVSFKLQKGTIHSLVGRNGAGKSTVVNVIAGVIKQDEGEVLFEGKDISSLSLRERQKQGIRLVTQHASIIPDLDVAENIFLGLWPKKNGLVDWKKMHEMAEHELAEFGLEVDTYKKLRELSPVDQRKINIVRALFGGGRLIILDEPTTSLSIEDRDNLFAFVRGQAEHGTTFILISHYLEEILRVSDEITVVRDGQAFPGNLTNANSQDELAQMIAGEDVELTYRDSDKVVSREIVLECEDVSAEYLKPTSVKVYKGEIVGFVGFPGSGAREICWTMYGISKKRTGTIKMHGIPIDVKRSGDALKYKLCYVPNDRHMYGIVPIMSIKENIGLSSLRSKLRGNFRLLDSKKERSIAEQSVADLKIKALSVDASASSLSGGNQQKVVLAKVLSCEPDLLILDEPTIGIDVKSREEIMKMIKNLTALGLSVIYVTNDFDELLRIADRVVVFNNGEIVGNVENQGLTPADVIEMRDNSKKEGEAV